MSVRIPKYRLHRGSGQALVQLNGKRIYLGKYGTPQSHEEYRRLIAQFLSGKDVDCVETGDSGLTINELILRFFKFAMRYYQKDGHPTDEIAGIRAALKRLRIHYGHKLAGEFGPKDFKLVRETMIQAGYSRKYINDSMARIRRMFRWAVSEELVEARIYETIASVQGLAKGRSEARETEPIAPVPTVVFEATLRHCPCVVADMARIQGLTGCRPQEICVMRPCDIDRTADVWSYYPRRHKTEHLKRSRVIFIGSQAQRFLAPYLQRAEESYCFSPRESVVNHGRRVTNGQRAPRSKYDRHSYRQAIQRACVKAGVTKWSPNQLRHNVASNVRKRYGLEAAQAVLGHTTANVTEIYAQRDQEKARQVMREVG